MRDLSGVKLMGILNVTPDSFSDGGKFFYAEEAVERALQMQAEGAQIIDMGAESTRPGSAGVAAFEQMRRLIPVLKAFRKKSRLTVSIDTQSSAVATACLLEGADMINDISALRTDKMMLRTLAGRPCKIVLMHMQGTPATMQADPTYGDVVAEIIAFFKERLAACAAAGIESKRIWLDPGIGFGKTVEHNLEILRRLGEFQILECPLLVGLSRKGFLGKITGESDPAKRLVASVTAGLLAALSGADVLRVHDVAEHAAALRVAGAVRTGSAKEKVQKRRTSRGE